MQRKLISFLSGSALLFALGCGGSDDEGGEEPAFGGEADVATGVQLWTDIDGYSSWQSFPGKEGFQPSRAPHGAFVKFYLNDTALADTDNYADGSVIVKENYTAESDDALAGVTVMFLQEGYAPDAGDWFWVKYGASGAIDRNGDDTPLAGQIGKGGSSGCIPCHSSAQGGDLSFINDGE